MKSAIDVLCITNTGLEKTINEDSVLLGNQILNLKSQKAPQRLFFSKTDKGKFFVVADGMGGHGKGELASLYVLETFLDNGKEVLEEEGIHDLLNRAKSKLDISASNDPSLLNFGTVVAGIYISNNQVIVFNVGDSRIYRYDGMFCEQLSHDHSKVQEIADMGIIDQDDIRYQANKNIVTSALVGNPHDKHFKTYIKTYKLKANDMFFICSDGVWECLSIEEMEECLSDFNSSLDNISKKVLEAGAHDNFSAIVIKVLDE